MPLLAGRDFDEHDIADGQKVCLISQAGAKKVFRDENPIGKTLFLPAQACRAEIVGIVGDVRSVQRGRGAGHGILSAVGAGKFPIRQHHRPQQSKSRMR